MWQKTWIINKDYIKQLLENDIVAAYYFQAGAIQNSLRYDKQVKAAVKLLKFSRRIRKNTAIL